MRKLLLLNRFTGKFSVLKKSIVFSILMLILHYNTTYVQAQCTSKPGEISGVVLNDINFNSNPELNDPGINAVEVFAYDSHQTLVSKAITDNSGKFELQGLVDGSVYRIEFKYPELFYPAKSFKDVMELKAPGCDVKLLLHKPTSYTHKNPLIVMPMFIQGKQNEFVNSGVILTFPENFSSGSTIQEIAKKNETGAVWGAAFKRSTQQLFTSAFVKQYAYLGPGGYGAIYVSKKSITGWSTTLFVDLAALGINLGPLSIQDAQDCGYGAQVGYTGLGSLELSEDEKFLFVTNLFKNTLIKIPTDQSKFNEIEEIQIPNPGCIGGNMHAFALKNHNGKLYIGVSCGAELSKNTLNNTMHVYEFDIIQNTFNEIFQSDYPRGYLSNNPSHDVKVQHWLTDIEFSDEGNMILVLNDRIGHRYCSGTAGRLDVQNGDILVAWKNNGNWLLENNGSAGIYSGTGVGNGQGPGGGEFFGFDFWPTNPGLHPETATGSALVIPGSGEVIVPVYDPEASAYAGGIKKFNTTDGTIRSVFSVYSHKTYPQFGKASAFGDVDALYDPLPQEIGDFVWFDEDKDGIQDPGEKGVAGVLLSLYDQNCNKVGSAVTDLNGMYVFNNTNVDLDGNGSFDNLEILKKYYVVLDDVRFSADNLKIDGKPYYLTIDNKGVGANKDKNDSDGIIAQGICDSFNGKPYIQVNTESSGQNRYDADFGFSEVKIFDLALRKTLVTNNNVGYGDNVTFKISVFNQGTLSAQNIFVTDYINTSGYEYDEVINPEWVFNADKATYRFVSELKPGNSFDAFITLKVKSDAKLQDFINYAEISSAQTLDGNAASDVDSKMDNIKDNDIGGQINYGNAPGVLVTDDLIDDDGSLDEDDHDPATINILDLALIKMLITEKPVFRIKDTVSFGITVYNQGSVTAKTFEIVDYLTDDFVFDPKLNPGWVTYEANKAKFTVTDELKPFENRQLIIKLIISENTKTDNLMNYAEVMNVTSELENNPKDYDSTPNDIKTDDSGAIPETVTQHNITLSPRSPVPDEDDHDIATLSIKNYDLALTKIAKRHNMREGESVEFEIEVFNQGAITADKITIVDYLPEGFILEDSKWKYTGPDKKKAEILLSTTNGYLPLVGLLPGKSIKVSLKLFLDNLADGVNFLTNYAEISSSFDISGNNLGLYDRDSRPDDFVNNDNKGTDNQLNGNGDDDEDDHDWATVFVRTEIILDPCICLNNASDPENGQFRIEVAVISPSGQNWRLDSIVDFYDLASPAPPAAPVLYALNTPLTEDLNNPEPGLSRYWIQAVHINNIPYYIRVVNDLGDKQELYMHSGLCEYNVPQIAGNQGTCLNTAESYSINNPDPSAVYSWSLPAGGGTIIGSATGASVDILWGATPGVYGLRVIDATAVNCIAPKTIKVKIGNSAGAIVSDDYLIASVDVNCELVVTPEMILESAINPNTPFEITLVDPNGNILPSNIITSEYIGIEITASIKDQCSGQRATTVIKAVDLISPVLDCTNAEIECENMGSYPGPSVTDNCDNDPMVIITNETSVLENCTSAFSKIITRDYVAFDKYGNQSEPCKQKISVRRLNKSAVEFPQDWLISDNSALTCNAYKLDKNGNPHPSVTGTPLYFGKDLFTICNYNFCEVTVGYNDFIAASNDCYKKIIRTWHVFENCEDITFDNIITHIQIIEIHDLIPPIPELPDNFTVTTDGYNCSALVNIPSLNIKDNCSTMFKVNINYPGGFLENSNGGSVRLYEGKNHIRYTIYDQCNNFSIVDLNITVVDKTPPVAICQRNTVVSLLPTGEAFVPALSFNSGSYDDCQIDRFEVKRMFNDDFGPDIRFTCNDLDSSNIMIVLRVYDISKNWNECMVNIVVQHKYPPQIQCPDNLTVECDFPYESNNLAKYFGTATGTDVCGVDVKEKKPEINISQCGVGTISRTFIATGRGGLTKECTQTIKFVNSKPFNKNDITWPKDTIIAGACGAEQLSPDKLGWPVLREDECDIAGYEYEDTEFFGVQGDACYTIVRTWSVVDMCQKENGQFKKWYNDQLIHVKNKVNPYILPLSSVDTCTYDSNCQSGFVILKALAQDDCTDSDDFQWRFAIDLYSNGTYDIKGNQVGAIADASGTYPIGNHVIIWTVEDRCGNSYTRTQNFRIKNCTKPTAICIDNLVIELGPVLVNGKITAYADLIAENLNQGSYHSCGFPLKFSFSENVNDTLIKLDCSWLSKDYHDIYLYVTDPFGNFDFCKTRIEVQDNFYICNPFDRCVTWPKDTIIVSACNPNLTPGGGIADALIVNNKCNCSDFKVTYTDKYINVPNSTCNEIDRTWKVDFNCAALDTTIYFLQKFILKNSETPALNCVSPPVVNAGPNCNAFVNIGIPTYVADECTSVLTLSHNSQYAANPGVNASGIYPVGTTQVKYTLTDICNHQSVCNVIVIVQDNTNPICNPNNYTIALDANGQAEVTGANVASGSTDNCGISSITVVPNTFGCDDLGPNPVVITVRDIYNNSSTCNAIVTVIDTLTHLCNSRNATLILNSNGTGILNPIDVYAGSGGCGGSSNVTLQVIPNTFDCQDIGENIVNLIVTDNVTGESDTCTAIVTVIDQIAPQCLVNNITIYIGQNGTASFTFSDIDDGSFDPCGEIIDTFLSTYSFTCEDAGLIQAVQVVLTDNSGNTSTCQALITVQDTIKPVCNAVDTLEIPLDNTGMAVITGQTVDFGSYDQCGYITLSVNPDTFYCNDAGIPIEFLLTVGDGNGNFSTCTGILIVRDTTPPTIICPADTSISCLEIPEEELFSDVFGEPLIFDNCSQGGDYNETVISNINDCGAGVITRNFSVQDPSENISTCTQLIIVESESYTFGESNIIWPEDTLILDNCITIDPDSIDSHPIVNLQNTGCAKITITYDDTNLTPGGECNDTIQRIWTVKDFCQFSTNPNTGVFEFTQILIISDDVAPIIIAPSDTVIIIPSDLCDSIGYVDLYGYVLDCDEDVVVTNNSPYADNPNSADASGTYPSGKWDVLITATDKCGNASTKLYNLTVTRLSFCEKSNNFLMPESEMLVVYVDYLTHEQQDCANLSFSETDPDLDSLIFDCDDINQMIQVPIYKFNGDQLLIDQCIARIFIEDPNGYCSGNIAPGIFGSLATENNYGVEDAEIYITGTENTKLISEVDGQFEYIPPLPEGNYTVKPRKKNDYLNGVNTLDLVHIQKHILGIRKLGTPYRLLAADVDNNKKITASDILNIRKLILGEVNEFKNNDSWKFIDSGYEFNNPSDPLNEEYMESLDVKKLKKKQRLDFTGIKLGDVNNSVTANKLMALAPRTAKDLVLTTDHVNLDKDKLIQIPINNMNDISIEGLQFTLEFNPEYLEFKGFNDAKLDISSENFSLKKIDKGIITFSWNDSKPIDLKQAAELFGIEFKVRQYADISEVLRISDRFTNSIAFDAEGNELGIKLEYRSPETKDFILYQNEPNPWASSTSIGFDLPKAGEVKMSISNGYGVILQEKILTGKQGFNSVTINKENIDYSGLLIIDLEFEGKHQIKKMIKF
ncbi:MAG: SdrD B-like domain-containing protein [Deltaproteobacteria bacterium]